MSRTSKPDQTTSSLPLIPKQTLPERETTVPIYDRVSFLEFFMPSFSGTDMADMLTTSPHINKTHLSVQFVPKSFWEQNCKVIYFAHNAKDNVMSYFHFDHMDRGQSEPGDWGSFLQRFKDGNMVFGSWYDHVCGWWEKEQMYSKIHYMFFEDLVEMDLPRPELFDFHGVSMTHYFTDNWENVQNFKARPDDIVIATYPKAGTTWVAYILDLLYFRQTMPERESTIPVYDRIPFLEMVMPPYPLGTEMANTLSTSPRIIKTHLPVQFIPKSFWEQNCKIVYCARNAKDNVVSYFHFDRMEKLQPEPGDWTSFLQRFKEGKMVFGSWYDHVCGWWEKKQMYSKIHYMFYEDLVEDTGREIKRLCSFLGLSTSEEEKEKIRGAVQFDVMKANPMTNLTEDGSLDFSVSQFLRKGKVGDWKNHFTVAQNEQFDEHYKQKMKSTSLQFRTVL